MKNRLTSCILHSTNQKDGMIIREPIPSSYQPQHSLTYLRIDIRDLVSLKYLLMFLPKLSVLGKIEFLFLTYYAIFSRHILVNQIVQLEMTIYRLNNFFSFLLFFVYFRKVNFIIIDIHLGIDVVQSDQELFPISFNPCCYLNKLIMR
jgi:hypothetical protein